MRLICSDENVQTDKHKETLHLSSKLKISRKLILMLLKKICLETWSCLPYTFRKFQALNQRSNEQSLGKLTALSFVELDGGLESFLAILKGMLKKFADSPKDN